MIAATWSTVDTALLVTVIVLLAASGFFAMAETALVRMNKSRARGLRDQGRHGADQLVKLADAPETFLNPLLLLILICQLVSATLVGVLAGHLFGASGIVVATVLEVVVIFVAFEAVPKNLAVAHPDSAALFASPVVSAILGFWPIKGLSWLLLHIADFVLKILGAGESSSRMTEAEMIAMADVAAEEDVIEETERDFIQSVLEFGDTVVREVMRPRIDVVSVAGTATVNEALAVAVESGRSRLPVVGEGIDDVIGIVNLRHLASLATSGHGDEPVSDSMGKATFVPETKSVSALMLQMRKTKTHLALVVDEYGGTAGLVTLEDILEELVGEIADESDTEVVEEEEKEPADVLELSGRLNIDDLNDEYDLSLPKDGWDTLGGLIMDLAGGVPAEGDAFEVDAYVLTVLRMDGRRVEDVKIERTRAQ